MTQYDRSFSQPASTSNPFVIGVSTGGSSGGSGQ
jgi:hypothetical protein